MKTSNITLISIIFLVLLPYSCLANAQHADDFLECLYSQNNTSMSNVVYTPTNTSYTSILDYSKRNLRFTSSSTPRPLVIITPVHESQIPPVIYCSRLNGLQMRIRSGGHDYEGLSYRSPRPFIILDFVNMREITIDAEKKTAWLQPGATLGELYYAISQASNTLAFPGGVCPTVGAGGHISGGGYGPLLRKFGLAIDNVVNAHIFDANGNFLDRKSMGKDVFWAIRGGGAASLGVLVSWKIKLVTVPETVTVFQFNRPLEQNMTNIVHKWQYIAPYLPNEVFIAVFIHKINMSRTELANNLQAMFTSTYLGRVDKLLSLMQEKFPELGLRREDCIEVSWIQSVLFWGGCYSLDEDPKVLTTRIAMSEYYEKVKSDYVQKPIPRNGIEGLWEQFAVEEANTGRVVLIPYGGRNSEIPVRQRPFPHRAGNLFFVIHSAYWTESGDEASERHIGWLRRMYDYFTPFVSKNPRASYANYRDLDLGVNDDKGNTSFEQSSVWGRSYFEKNFKRLARVKTLFDPTNFFRHEQSIPLIDS